MSLLVTLNGSNYIIPETNEVGWGSNLDDYFVAIAAGVLQKTGGSFTLSAETDFGASYGLKSLYFSTRGTPATDGQYRLGNTDIISWRNGTNTGNMYLSVNSSNQLTYDGVPIAGTSAFTASRAIVSSGTGLLTAATTTSTEIGYVNGVTSAIQTQLNAKQSTSLTSAHILVGNGGGTATDVAVTGDIGIDNAGLTSISSGVIVNADVNASAAIAYSKLNLTGTILNADINASAAIAYSKLNLSASIVNADVSASAAIAYSKLNLATSIVNADISGSAAIAYSKLNLSASIVNADISSSAAIGITKIANGTANQVLGTNSGASANEWKTLTATSNQVSVTHGVGTVTFATPQDIGTSSAVRFGTLTLGGALDASSALSITSTTKGFLPPAMTTTQKNAISSPTDGLIVFDITLAQLYLRTGGVWTPLSVGGGSGTVGSGTQYQLAYYAANGTTVSGLTAITASRALASDANGLPVAATTTATELGYVNGVTSAIQTQMNLKAPLASPTFTGTVTYPTPFTLGAVSVTATGTEMNYLVGVTSAIQTQLNLLAPKASPTFTGTITTPLTANRAVATGSAGVLAASATTDTELGYVSGVTSALQTQINNIPDNMAMNGGFDYWTAGTSFSTPATGTTTADFWTFNFNNSIGNVTVSQEASTIDTGTYSAKFLMLDGNTATQIYLQQNVINFAQYAGYTVTLTARVRTNNTGMKIMLIDNNGNSVSSAITADSAFHTVTVSRTLAAGITSLAIRIGFVDTTPTVGTSYFGPVMLSFGAVSESYTPRPGLIQSSQIKGTTTNDSAAVGYVGQVIESVSTSNTTFPSTTVWGDLTSISLTAGDWLVTGCLSCLAADSNVTDSVIGVSTTSGNSATGLVSGSNQFSITATSLNGRSNPTYVPSYHMQLSATTTVYLKYRAAYSGTAPTANGRITAVRIR